MCNNTIDLPQLREGKITLKTKSLDTLELTSDFSLKNESKTTLNLRRKSKALSTAINGQLCYVNSTIHKDYQAAYFCNTYLFQDGNLLTGTYCKKRSCLICSRIMAARLFKSYAKPLLELNDLYLVTLTAPTVPGEQLRTEIAKRYEIVTKIKDSIRKVHKIKLRGFRKLEIAHNSRTKLFHPHYHLLIESKEAANLVHDYWLKLMPGAKHRAQDVRKVTSSKGLFEVFKYITKAVTKDTFDKYALDEMYVAIKGVRTYQSFGIKKTQEVKIEKYETLIISHKSERIDVWKWCKEFNDWYDSKGEQLNDGMVPKETKDYIKIINKIRPNEKERKGTQDYQSYGGFNQKERSREKAFYDD